jgi:hypothetical protein
VTSRTHGGTQWPNNAQGEGVLITQAFNLVSSLPTSYGTTGSDPAGFSA